LEEKEMTPRATEFADRMKQLHQARWAMERVTREKGKPRRRTLNKYERETVLAKTAGRCHICGGDVEGNSWHADHVLAHTAGGVHDIENYLAAHALCNMYRCNLLPEEFQWVLKIGIWARTQMERKGPLGQEMCEMFLEYEANRERRRKQPLPSAV
jgi:hypothetical protein